MIGPFLNAFGILFGALFGLIRREPLTPATQKSCQSALGALTMFCGLHLIWLNVDGTLGHVLKQLFIALLALLLGNLLGKLLGIQKMSNYVGRHAAGLLGKAEKNLPTKPTDGFVAASVLFCAAPMGIIGAVTDGLNGYFYPLAVKAAMDGLAMTSFVKMFRWPTALAAIPVFLFVNGLALLIHVFILPRLTTPEMVHSVGAVGGLILCATTLVILSVRRVELANYLPALAVAPLVTRYLL